MYVVNIPYLLCVVCWVVIIASSRGDSKLIEDPARRIDGRLKLLILDGRVRAVSVADSIIRFNSRR
jgi:hypothetical protein